MLMKCSFNTSLVLKCLSALHADRMMYNDGGCSYNYRITHTRAHTHTHISSKLLHLSKQFALINWFLNSTVYHAQCQFYHFRKIESFQVNSITVINIAIYLYSIHILQYLHYYIYFLLLFYLTILSVIKMYHYINWNNFKRFVKHL